MIRRLAGTALAACALAALPGVAQAEVPAGPRLSFMRSGSSELVTSNPAGRQQEVIAGIRGGGPIPFGPAAWSADGSHVFFPGVSHSGVFGGIYLAGADGSAPKSVPGTRGGSNPVLSPDGQMLAFTRGRERSRHVHGSYETVYESRSIWLLDLDGGRARQITPWRNGLFETPSSFSPDGSILAITRSREQKPGLFHDTAVALRLDGSEVGVLANNGKEPMYSPDGGRVAMTIVGKLRPVKPGLPFLFRPADIALANPDGSGLTMLTHTPRLAEQEPSWDPSGERLTFTQDGLAPFEYQEIGDSIMEINADGSCRTKILPTLQGALYGVAWQPGPGREAGPIVC